MILSAIYIPNNALTHVFGDEHEGKTINLGGKYLYKIENKEEVLEITRVENIKFINDFWGKNISLVSVIVGANGVGKTSILRHIVNSKYINPSPMGCILIYEKEDDIYIKNESVLKYFTNINEIDDTSKVGASFLYYSPNLDQDLTSISSPISLVNYHKNNLINYYLGGLKRHMFFLKNETIVSKLKASYNDFPFYDKLIFKAAPLYKEDFIKKHIEGTLGNNFIALKNHLLTLVEKSKEKEIILNEKKIHKYFDNNDSIKRSLELLWKKYPNSTNNKQQYLHGGESFLTDVEVNLLSYLVVDDYVALDGDHEAYSFSKVLESETFEEKLTHFLNKFIAQSSKKVYNILIDKKINIEVSNLISLKESVEDLLKSESRINELSFIVKKYKIVLRDIELIDSVFKFYTKIASLERMSDSVVINGGFEISIKNLDVDIFSDLFDLYEEMLSKFNSSYFGGVLKIESEKKLSTGEKALLDLYASIYDYLKRWNSETRYEMYPQNCILLLDEPELGYHPLWKKKFIKALTTSLNVLFGVNKNIKNIQIIFTTHETLTLSDMPNNNIVYLCKSTIGNTKLLDDTSKQRPTKTFGANINDLLADSFFIKDGLIGDFAKGHIEKTIKWINHNKENTKRDCNFSEDLERYKKIISIIDEPIVKLKLSEMIYELEDPKSYRKSILEEKIKILRSELNSLT